jgi:hypothetical protein
MLAVRQLFKPDRWLSVLCVVRRDILDEMESGLKLGNARYPFIVPCPVFKHL